MDSTLRTFTIDWYPQPLNTEDCANDPEFVANIYFDPFVCRFKHPDTFLFIEYFRNLLDASSPGQDAGSSLPSTPDNPSSSTEPPNAITFQYNSSQACGNTATLQDSANTFRTISKLSDLPTNGKGKSTLQAYPIDRYVSPFFSARLNWLVVFGRVLALMSMMHQWLWYLNQIDNLMILDISHKCQCTL